MRRYKPALYARLHRTLYWNFGRIAGRCGHIQM
jgi:hypothetical protein